MKMSEQDFWNSPFKKIIKLIDIYKDERNLELSAVNQAEYTPKYFAEEAEVIHSMREVEGFT